MQYYIVLYRINSIMFPMESPLGFQCWADSPDHAEEQCLNAYPNADIVWVWQGSKENGIQSALDEYYTPTIID